MEQVTRDTIHKKSPYIRLKTISIEEAFALIQQEQGTMTIDGELVSTDSLRLRTFLQSIRCTNPGCDQIGAYFAIEKTADSKNCKINRWHMNLWAVNQGHEILMTCDHKVARALGGADRIDNTQTMCSPCNWNKSKWECRYINERRKFPFLLF